MDQVPSHENEISMLAHGGPGLKSGDALLIIDVQADFLPGGSLAVPNGDAVIGPLNDWIARFSEIGLPIFATLDWHPPDHCSFRGQGGAWPAHCVAGTPGARFGDGLALPAHVLGIGKATRRDVDAYSGFVGTELHAELQRAGVRRLFVGGLATDYCVLESVLDALRLGYEVVLLCTTIRAVDVRPGDGQRAIAAMVAAGAVAVEG